MTLRVTRFSPRAARAASISSPVRAPGCRIKRYTQNGSSYSRKRCPDGSSRGILSGMEKRVIVFGGGCFWCTEAIFQELKGVLSVMPGYAGGTVPNPTYEAV